MQPNLLITFTLSFFLSPIVLIAQQFGSRSAPNNYKTVGDIPVPDGFSRTFNQTAEFASWLRSLALKRDRVVYLYNGRMKPRQDAQFAVLDISVGAKDLQQCADAVMRLRAEWLLSQKRWKEIVFADNNHVQYRCPLSPTRNEFLSYMDKVFAFCGTISLQQQLKRVETFTSVVAGDVFIRGGSPGHAAIVVDMAINPKGEKVVLIANSYMPAQDIHIVVNPVDPDISPWYRIKSGRDIRLPEWTFTPGDLRRW